MAKFRKKYKITQEEARQLKKGPVRQMKKEQGAFDGRFRTKAEKDKSKYNRKKKHKNDEEDL